MNDDLSHLPYFQWLAALQLEGRGAGLANRAAPLIDEHNDAINVRANLEARRDELRRQERDLLNKIQYLDKTCAGLSTLLSTCGDAFPAWTDWLFDASPEVCKLSIAQRTLLTVMATRGITVQMVRFADEGKLEGRPDIANSARESLATNGVQSANRATQLKSALATRKLAGVGEAPERLGLSSQQAAVLERETLVAQPPANTASKPGPRP